MIGSNIHPIDALLGRAGQIRRDDIVGQLVDVRQQQDRIVRDIGGLRPPPSVQRLREANDVHQGYAELFADLELEPPAPRADGNAVAAKLDHLRALQSRLPQDHEWRDTKLGNVAQVDPGAFSMMERDIVAGAKRVAADPSVGSFRKPGALRRTVCTDEGGHRVTKWHGDPASWMAGFCDPSMRYLLAVGNGYGEWYPKGPSR